MGSTLKTSNTVSVAIPLGSMKRSIFRVFLKKTENGWRY